MYPYDDYRQIPGGTFGTPDGPFGGQGGPFDDQGFYGGPFGGPGGPGGPFDPGGQFGGQVGPGGTSISPPGPPPQIVPQQAQAQALGGPSAYALDPGAVRPCRFRFVYIWLRNGRAFWAWLTFVGRESVAGYRWTGRRWVYFAIDLDRIVYFQCF